MCPNTSEYCCVHVYVLVNVSECNCVQLCADTGECQCVWILVSTVVYMYMLVNVSVSRYQ